MQLEWCTIVSHLHTLLALFRTDTHIHIQMCIFNSAIWINKRATGAIKENSSSIHKYVECKHRKMLGFYSYFHFIHTDISYSFYVKRSFVIPVVSFVLVSSVPLGTYKVNTVRSEIWNWRQLNAILLCNFLQFFTPFDNDFQPFFFLHTLKLILIIQTISNIKYACSDIVIALN